jgi:alpha-N-arabinofuranosidase
MVLTPTYHVFKMYVPFQDATFLPSLSMQALTQAATSRFLASMRLQRKTHRKTLAGANKRRPNNPVEIEVSLTGVNANSATGQTLTAPKVDSVNTFDTPNTVTPKPISAKIQNGRLTIKLDANR